MQANRLHLEAALLSNTLHEYRDDDIDGVKPIIDKIVELRRQWTIVKKDLAYFDKTGKLPEASSTRSALEPIASTPELAELRVELARLNSNISKYQRKIETTPEHKKVELWKEDLAKMEALKQELKQKIVNLQYASK